MKSSTSIVNIEQEAVPNFKDLGLIEAGSLGAKLPAHELRQRLVDHFAKHPRRTLAPGEKGAVELLREAREHRSDRR